MLATGCVPAGVCWEMSKQPSDVATCLAVFADVELLDDVDAVADSVAVGDSEAVGACEVDGLVEVPGLDAVWLHPAIPTARQAADAIMTSLMPVNVSTHGRD